MTSKTVEKIWASTFVSHPFVKGDTWVPQKRAKAAIAIALKRDDLRAALTAAAEGVTPQIVMGDEDSIYLTERQEGFREGLAFALSLLGEGIPQ